MLPQKHRLRTFRDFKIIFKEGRFARDSFLVIRFRKNDLPDSKFAFVVSTKVSKSAVKRNKIKRRLREVIKNILPGIKQGMDIVFIANTPILDKSYQDMKIIVEKLLKRNNLMLL